MVSAASTLGATVAFLTSRYAARPLVEGKLAGGAQPAERAGAHPACTVCCALTPSHRARCTSLPVRLMPPGPLTAVSGPGGMVAYRPMDEWACWQRCTPHAAPAAPTSPTARPALHLHLRLHLRSLTDTLPSLRPSQSTPASKP